ncbi:MAG: globin [Parvibaculum sp.]|uniref:globin n=1 Tax=Parvibaculum sp. TaxID=2024848 RepID=UPI0025FA05AC|nr:globin [Parvibaculum sp.]MCE9648725.1 globin [Parvibaculum sp.]
MGNAQASAIDGRDAALIVGSLELAAERCDDPTPLVYMRLFRQQPEMEALFVMDKDGQVRGHMLSEALEGIIDFLGARHYSDNLIRSEIVNHEGLGVPREVFTTFFTVVMETFREVLGDQWTAETDAAWRRLLDALAETVERQS